MPQKITFIGSGQITAAFATFLALSNRRLLEQGKEPVEISILGREGSSSLEAMQRDGISLWLKINPNDAGPTAINVDPREFKYIGSDVGEILPQDHIFVATKAFDHGAVISSINALKDTTRRDPDKVTTVIFAQNGLPNWLLAELGDEQMQPSAKEEDKAVIRRARDFVNEVGKNNIVACVLNIACKHNDDGSYMVSTPFPNIGIPMDSVDGEPRDHRSNIANLQNMFEGVLIGGRKLDVSIVDGNIRKEVLRKLQINAAVNGPCTITKRTIAGIMDDELYSKIAYAAAVEVSEFAAQIYRMDDLRTREEVAARLKRSANHPTSMAIDFKNGKDMEIDEIYRRIDLVSRIAGYGSKKIIRAIGNTLNKMQSQTKYETEEGVKISKEELARSVIVEDIVGLLEMAGRYRPKSPPPARGKTNDDFVIEYEKEFQISEPAISTASELSSVDGLTIPTTATNSATSLPADPRLLGGSALHLSTGVVTEAGVPGSRPGSLAKALQNDVRAFNLDGGSIDR